MARIKVMPIWQWHYTIRPVLICAHLFGLSVNKFSEILQTLLVRRQTRKETNYLIELRREILPTSLLANNLTSLLSWLFSI